MVLTIFKMIATGGTWQL